MLGKFAPHMSSLMVNPHLEAKPNSRTNTKKEKCNYHTRVNNDKINSEYYVKVKTEKNDRENDCTWIKQEKNDIDNVSIIKTEDNMISNTLTLFQEKLRISTVSNQKKVPKIKTVKKLAQKRQLEYNADDEGSRDSGLVIDIKTNDKPKVKRKYTKRQSKTSAVESALTTEIKSEVISCPMPVDVKEIKVEPETNPTTPRVKRKYVKHKLVRKKYTKREPKKKPVENEIPESNSGCSQDAQKIKHEQSSEDMDLWIELNDDLLLERFGLLNEEADSFWETIGDPSSFFTELEIE